MVQVVRAPAKQVRSPEFNPHYPSIKRCRQSQEQQQKDAVELTNILK
jgi:hypothetical protein